MAGLMSESVRKVCNAVMKEVMPLGVTEEVASLKSDWRGAVAGPPRVRAKLCLSDAKLPCFDVGNVTDGVGDEGLLDGDDVDGYPFFPAGEGVTRPFELLFIFFFDPNDRKKDHSDSN